MATVRQYLTAECARFPTSAFPALTRALSSSIAVASLAYDGTSSERAFFQFSPISYGSGNITITIEWYADTASSGAVVWEAALAAITPNTDTQDIETKTVSTVNTATDTHLGTTGQRLHSIDITVSNLDSIAVGDYAVLRIGRLPSDAGDTMSGDASLVGVGISYSDT